MMMMIEEEEEVEVEEDGIFEQLIKFYFER